MTTTMELQDSPNTPALPPSEVIMLMLMGIFRGKAVSAMADLGIADALEQKAKTATEVARELGTHEDSTYRLMRALAGAGVLVELAGQEFSLSPVGELLRTNHPQSMRAMARMIAGGEHYRAWGQLAQAVKTGEVGVVLSEGCEIWDYYSRDAERAAIFSASMTSFGMSLNEPIATAFEFGKYKTICDVGGGHGSQLLEILRQHPGTKGIVFDQPEVVAQTTEILQAAGMAKRAEAIGGTFLESVVKGADVYLARWVLHDWSDERSIRILKNIRAVVPANGRLLLAEIVVAPANSPDPAKLMDLNMLLITGGRERSAEEYRLLLEASGFELGRVIPTGTMMFLIEGIPV